MILTSLLKTCRPRYLAAQIKEVVKQGAFIVRVNYCRPVLSNKAGRRNFLKGDYTIISQLDSPLQKHTRVHMARHSATVAGDLFQGRNQSTHVVPVTMRYGYFLHIIESYAKIFAIAQKNWALRTGVK